MTWLRKNWLWLRTDNNYFIVALLIFIASFMLLPTAKQVNDVYYLSFFPVAILFLFRKPALLKLGTPELCLWFAFFTIAAIMGLLDTGGTFQYFKHIAYTLIFVLATSTLAPPHFFRTPEFKRGFFWCVCFYITASSLFYWATGAYAAGERIIWLPGRIDSPIYNSMWLIACFALVCPHWIQEKRHGELLSALLLSTFCVSYLLQSRSGLVGLLALPVFMLLGSKGRIGASRLVLGVFVVALAMLAVWATGMLQTLLSRADGLRFVIWSEHLSDWQKCGLIQGCGLSHKEVFFSLQGVDLKAHSHNIFLSLGVRLGIISLLTFLATMALTLWRARKNQDSWGLYLGVALSMLCFDGDLLIGNPDELWLLVLLPAGLIINRFSSHQENAALRNA